MTRAETFWLPRYLFILAQNECNIRKQNIKVYDVNLSKSIYELQVIFFIGVTTMIVTIR